MLRAPKNKARADGDVGEIREIETLKYKSKHDPQTLVNKLKSKVHNIC